MANNGQLYTNGVYNFGVGTGKTQTTRTASNGLVTLSANAINNSTEATTNVVDGFVKILPSATPAFYKSPLGFGNFYGPIGFNTTNQQPIVNAYIRGNTTAIGTTIPTAIDKISSVEYWKVASSNVGKITLYWSTNSDLTTILGGKSLLNLTILGFDGTDWLIINSEINSGYTTASGSMTSTSDVSLAGYTHFAIGSRKDLDCYSPVTYSGDINAKTWNGTSWSPSAPTITDKIIINAPLTITTPIECYSVEINADIIMPAGTKLTVVNGFEYNGVDEEDEGKIVMSNLASVIQQNPLATAPKIEMTRVAEQMRRYDYVFISNPISDISSFFSQLLDEDHVAVANTTTGVGAYGVYANSAFYNLRTFNADGLTTAVATAANTPIGRGLSAAVRSQVPYSTSNSLPSDGNGAWVSEKKDIHIKIAGTTNNGSYELDLPDTGGYTRLGNPYPSPIDIRKIWEFSDDKLEKTAYYWTYNTARANLSGSSYTNADFATFNLAGSVESGNPANSDGPTPTFIPDGYILPLQSVLVRSTGEVTLTIDNCVRSNIAPPAPPMSNTNESNGKFKLNLIGSANTFSQILISYNSAKGTLGFDNGYDSTRLIGLGSELSSIIDNSRYVIQTRPAFTTEDIVPLQIDKRTEETFTISLTDVQGVFNNTSILLHDKTLGIYHDLSVNNYAFVQDSALDTQRFDVVYQNTVLDNSNFEVKNAFAFITKNQFRAQSNSTIAEIAIYDIAGRLIITYSNVNAQGFSSNFDKAQGVYIAKIKLADGTIVNQKVINQ